VRINSGTGNGRRSHLRRSFAAFARCKRILSRAVKSTYRANRKPIQGKTGTTACEKPKPYPRPPALAERKGPTLPALLGRDYLGKGNPQLGNGGSRTAGYNQHRGQEFPFL
jgi:hypothetical protein